MASKIKTLNDFQAALYAKPAEHVTLDSGAVVVITPVDDQLIEVGNHDIAWSQAVWIEDGTLYGCRYASTDEEGIDWGDWYPVPEIYQVEPRVVTRTEYVRLP